ncbi:aBC transporter related [Clostridium sp. CAG:678]|nr:aBC transporter related [Clostridium sp. CAG:678]
MLSNLKYMLSNWIEWDKKSLLFFFVRVPALVLQPIVTAYIPKAMIDCIEKGVTTEQLILVVALLSLLLTFTIWMDPFMKELIRGGARIVRMRYAVMAFRKNLWADYVNIESLEGRELQKRAEAFYNVRFSSGADFIEECNDFLVCIIGVIASAVLIYKINILMILLILLTCVGEFVILKVLNKKQKAMLDDSSKLSSKLDYFYKLSKSSDASKDIKLYGFQDYFIYTVAKITSDIERIIAKYTNQSAAVSGIRAVLNLIRQLIAYVYLIYLVTNGSLTISEFVFYFGIITGFSNWIVNLVFSYSKIERSVNDCAVFRKYIESENESRDKPDVDFSEIESIEFKNVSFTYPSAEKSTIKAMSFKVNHGENIAIVGENGAGKTTAIKLLCGLYYPTEGDILINGKSSRDFSSESYFDLFSAVFQDYFFMPMTVAENISAEKEYDKEKLYSAFKKAGILEKINSLPDKENSLMDKNVYKNAVDFSGGEKQKLLLAKAVYKNAPVLILDEPTAALDPISENELYLKYNELTENKISFFISHRLSSTRFCNRILFIKDGKIAESGTHEELMALKGAYYRMYQIQSYYYKETEVAVNE